MAGRAGSRRRRARKPVAPYVLTVGQERCRERFLHVRRPMFHRVFLQGGAVVALARPGTKTAPPVAFELACGRELDIDTLPAEGAPAGTERVQLDYLSSPVSRGPSELRLLAESSSEPARTIELPDAISTVADAPFGWYVGLSRRVPVCARPLRRSPLALADAGGECVPFGRPGRGLLPTLPLSAGRERPLGARRLAWQRLVGRPEG